MSPVVSLLLLTLGCAPEAEPDPHPWATRSLLEVVPDRLGSDATSCAVIDATRCADGVPQVCTPWDVTTGEPTALDDVPLPLARAWHLDRQHDLHFLLDGWALNFETDVEMPPGTPESTWAAPEHFLQWEDHGDAAYYTGTYLYAAAHRYAVTGTDAELERVRDLTERQLLSWRVTGVPGYMFRSVFAMLPEGVPVPPGHPELPLHEHKERTNHVLYTLDGDALAWLPETYDGDLEIDGEDYTVTGTAEGSPSLDAYSAAINGLVHAHDVLDPFDDEALREEIEEAVTCHLHRYRKLRIRNVQDSPGIQELLQVFTGAGVYDTPPDELDLTGQDTLWGYVLEAKPPDGVDDPDFATDCPEQLPWDVDPAYDLDAADTGFLGELLDLVVRLQGRGDHPIDFIYFTNLRAGDAVYMTNLAVQAWRLTGDERYVDFIERELVTEQGLLDVLPTIDNFRLPDFCESWIGTDLLHPVVRATMLGLDDPTQPVPAALEAAMREGFRYGLLENSGQSWFQLTYSDYADPTQDPTLDDDLDAAIADLSSYVPEPTDPLAPKRATNRDWRDSGEDWVEPRWPTAEEIALCEGDVEVFGIEIPGPGIDPDEPINTTPVPAGRRLKESQIWHFTPFRLFRTFGDHLRGHEHSTDYTAPFWVGRTVGHWLEAEDHVLAWVDQPGSCEPDTP